MIHALLKMARPRQIRQWRVQTGRTHWMPVLLVLSLVVSLWPLPGQSTVLAAVPAASTAQPGDQVQLQNTAGGLLVEWSQATPEAWPADFEFQPAGHLQLPVYSFVVWPHSPDATPGDFANSLLPIEVRSQNIQPFSGDLPPAPAMQPGALDYVQPAYVETPATPPLPQTPLALVRAGSLRGQTELVLALSPVYADPHSGRLMLAQSLSAFIPGVYLPDPGQANDPAVQLATIDKTFAPANALPPTNPHAAGQSWKITVTEGGIQHLTGADLAAAGLTDTNTATLALFHNGQPAALQIIDQNNNGRIEGANEAIRFYAPPPDDRWNQTAIYWLVHTNADAARMVTQGPTTSDAPIRETAYAQGTWREPRLYNSNIAGPSADGWFHLDAVARAGVAEADRRFTANIAPTLPLATADDLAATVRIEAALYRLEGSTFNNTPHRLQFRGDGGSPTEAVYEFTEGGSSRLISFDATLPAPARELEVTFLMGERPLAVLFDRVHWRQPVALDFNIENQSRGARFTTLEGAFRYRLRNLDAGAILYEITDPRAPRIVSLTDNAGGKLFGAGPDAADYIVAGPGTLHTPTVAANNSSNLAVGGADTIYIAPAAFHETLAPLVQHRRNQGYTVSVVDVNRIYDGWSFGHVSPDAIRDFLRHAVAVWRPAPIAVVLVGDGTVDPHSYLGHNNPNVIPPYMAHVDPWLGETACDNCFGQLNGDHPLDEAAFTMDIWVGRFPVINTTELRNVVNKIISYETAGDTNARWRSTAVQITDDYFLPSGQIDRAGDFVESAEFINALKPSGIHVQRNYFNVALSQAQLEQLTPALRTLYHAYQPWFIHDPDQAWRNSIRLMNQGAGLVTYTGHANHWRWASTTEDSEVNRLFGLADVSELHNRNRLFIALSMTCYTSQFTQPAPSHFTLDESLFLRSTGGAVAVWGPSGLSVVHGHDILQKGFHVKLWAADPMTARMGELLEAGYAAIRRQACCQDTLKTFLLLGDPLTPARVLASDTMYLPTVQSAD